jgi:hypothetical protein
MKNFFSQGLLWSARMMAGAVLLFALYVVGGNVVGGGEESNGFQSTQEVLMFICFPVTTCIGLFIAFRWEGFGGLVATWSLFGLGILDPDVFLGSTPLFIIFSIPGFLFMLYWVVERFSPNQESIN